MPEPSSSQPSRGASGGRPASDALDELLATSELLAADVAAEVGSEGHGPSVDTSPDTAPELDEQLARLDGLIEQTQAEVGSARSSPDGAPHPSPSLGVPDFMKEFLEPEKPAAPEPPAAAPETVSNAPQDDAANGASLAERGNGDIAAPPAPSAAVPDFMSDLTQPEVDAPPPRAAQRPAAPEQRREPVPDTPPDADTEIGDSVQDESEEELGAPSAGRPLLERTALALCEPPVRVLELIDKPLGVVGPGARRVIGWLAIATLLTSAVVLVLSLR
ncbi:MAG: hypothetical protein HY763_00295 [Planctomycetes bacterium]|nr:hypothetical protein [Planctomycetota bacterium]